MSDLENAKARSEALSGATSRSLRSARRAQLWAGLNRYLASEAEHATKAARHERETERAAEIEEPPSTNAGKEPPGD